jgi:hypothetical protein
MTTSHVDRLVLREWRDSHDDVRPARDGERCVHALWVKTTEETFAHIGDCGQPAEWIVNYGRRVPSLGRRPHCEAHTVSVISKWAAFERGEVPA